jgi:hypothetical protein
MSVMACVKITASAAMESRFGDVWRAYPAKER